MPLAGGALILYVPRGTFRGYCMQEFIYDIYSIFYQLLQLTAPDYVGDRDFLLLAYIGMSLAIVITIWCFCRVCSALAQSVLRMIYRGDD